MCPEFQFIMCQGSINSRTAQQPQSSRKLGVGLPPCCIWSAPENHLSATTIPPASFSLVLAISCIHLFFIPHALMGTTPVLASTLGFTLTFPGPPLCDLPFVVFAT